MKVFVDDDSCRGHGVCAALCPSVFVITDGGYAEATSSEIPADLEASVGDAAESCPERAIHVS
jgi:ferredoxin